MGEGVEEGSLILRGVREGVEEGSSNLERGKNLLAYLITNKNRAHCDSLDLW